jgi:hypothetical protein
MGRGSGWGGEGKGVFKKTIKLCLLSV